MLLQPITIESRSASSLTPGDVSVGASQHLLHALQSCSNGMSRGDFGRYRYGQCSILQNRY